MNMVTKTYQLRDGEKLTEFYNHIDWEPLFEFVRRYFGIGVEQPPITCLKPNGRIEVNWPENLRDKCGLFGHTYREVYLQTFSSCCFYDITYDKDIVDKYLARPDFYRLNMRYAQFLKSDDWKHASVIVSDEPEKFKVTDKDTPAPRIVSPYDIPGIYDLIFGKENQ